MSVTMEEKLTELNCLLADFVPVRLAADRLNLQPLAVTGLGLLCAIGYFIWDYLGELFFSVAGTVYPMYALFRAKEDENHEQVRLWGTYFVTYAAFALIE